MSGLIGFVRLRRMQDLLFDTVLNECRILIPFRVGRLTFSSMIGNLNCMRGLNNFTIGGKWLGSPWQLDHPWGWDPQNQWQWAMD